MRLPRSVAGWTIAVFGGLALLLGAVGLVRPEWLLAMLGFEVLAPAERADGDYTGTFVAASSMASFNMGVYYLLAAWTEWRPFFGFTVLFRALTFTVFTVLVLTEVAPGRFLGVALWEGLGAVATAAGLWYDRHHNGNQPVTAMGAGG
ncbi:MULTISPECIES: hypothetical protein [unclassified Plantactinospora]|uniref:hypothetical protein n=1 Tax=unclassified Plantactinospora TaxID=2631981 RepID=UPI000D173E5B|nr:MULTISPECIES: hypothetical protein [unclassified Plantactinospora]AVT29754.1 hypothetical protein C6361_09940 [Plantactinospora sp. BC1]AVT36259.1 hypothetical protein C6W10_07040 [Plantactinospora sp. BB1]